MTAWTDTVKKTFKEGRLSNPKYQFKDALKDAKKFYKKGEVAVVDAAKEINKYRTFLLISNINSFLAKLIAAVIQ